MGQDDNVAGRRSPRDRRPARAQGADNPQSAGRPVQGDDVGFLVIGQVVGARGVRGEIKVEILTEDPQRFHILDRVYLGEEGASYRVLGASLHLRKNQAFLRLEGLNDREEAEAWREAYVYVAIEDALPLEEGQYYYHQIEGLTVMNELGDTIGRVREILPTGANDVYVIDTPEGELLLPAIRDVVLRIDLDKGVIVVRVPEGL